MRRVNPDPIPADAQARILDAAIRAPSGGNTQNWRFLLVDDRRIKERLGPLYRDSLGELWATAYKERVQAAEAAPDDPESVQTLRVVRSAQYLADHF
jgi:nitroreductase